MSGVVDGGQTADTLIAGNVGEILSGEGGHDALDGGTGADTFCDSLAAAGTDVVSRFSVGQDTIELSQAIYTALTVGEPVVFSVGSKATSAADH